MARVSQEHLDARRRQILDGAARCFARNGFHATSMQDVLKEADLSAGAVYRYFSGKEELIAAIVGEVLGQVNEGFEEAARSSPPPPPDLLVASVLSRVLSTKESVTVDGRPAFPRLVVQVWTETLRNDELAALLREGYGGVQEAWARIVQAYQDAGTMRPDVAPDHVARTMMASAMGFLAQQALFGPMPADVLRDGLRALMSVQDHSSVNVAETRSN
ncbi:MULTISPECIES: TetR/AcrR family transcriptional regulator [unclassified Streptomyces]|uniref:TetR/AcrR family transcriptional regulator n=1 Tax=unclassified Streptomyces TaxID=2593676 RepID=UPI00224F54DE|nr:MULTISPECIES: TetR/AcrR family transcriptional regulator [unclassified Streptomyces]MCX4879175.1 TetR/AcrR family transcriptional regulator [Streptomyces sp. NBC_00847]MCX5419122.1 TetR/AcrR family transcriptional regulator [Streptomyces sp. NBC_00078]